MGRLILYRNMANETLDRVLQLEMRMLQIVVAVLISVSSFFCIKMFDRLDYQFSKISADIEAIRVDNDERDQKLAELMLQIESRLTKLEVSNEVR